MIYLTYFVGSVRVSHWRCPRFFFVFERCASGEDIPLTDKQRDKVLCNLPRFERSAMRQCFRSFFFVARHRLLVAQATPLSRLVASSPSAIRSRVLIMLFRAFEEKIVSSLYTFFSFARCHHRRKRQKKMYKNTF